MSVLVALIMASSELTAYQDMSYRQGVPFYRSVEDDADFIIAKNVRQALTQDNILSLEAKNIQIQSVHGTVTLRGKVDSYEEKKIVEMKAHSISGVVRVVNDLEVKRQ
jgi:osmotically-inducible protein OsmY